MNDMDAKLGLGGLDEEIEDKPDVKDNIVKFQRKPFYEWTVGGETYKMKLNTSMICKLEEKYGKNLLEVVSSDNVPPLNVMLTIAQAAIIPWKHGVKYETVQKLFDVYIDEGGDQLSFYTNVIMQVMSISGFFTKDQAETISSRNLQEEMDTKI